MKKDKLYTVNQFNRKALTPKGKANVFASAGQMLNMPKIPMPEGYNLGSLTLPSFQMPTINSIQPKIASMKIPSATASSSTVGNGLMGTLGAVGGEIGYNLLSNGYHVDGTLGSIVDTLHNVKTGIPWVDLAKDGVLGAVNFLGGIKRNEKNINTLTQNTNNALAAGKTLSSASDTSSYMSAADTMTSGINFNTTDLVKGRLFSKGKARKEGQGYLDKQTNALAFQNNALQTGADKVDYKLDNNVMGNFAAYGGMLDALGNSDMAAVDYGFLSDYLLSKKKQADSKGMTANNTPLMNAFADGGIEIKHPGRLTRLKERTGKTEAELWAEGKPEVKKMITFARNARAWSKANGGKLHKDGVEIPNVLCGGGKMFDLGGDIQTNSADFTTGLSHINAGDSHELNPNGGVQVGVDPEGTPNLVEEGEVIFNDYVYSNRIYLDEKAKKKMHFSKKRDITYAEAAKLLEKEAAERPNDPISKAGLKAHMEDLANEQERQKAEMEEARAREAFEALSPEEKIAVMQQAQQQEQAMQEQAIAEQAAAQQPMEQEVPQQAPKMQEQMVQQPQMAQPEVVQQPIMAAEGGKINTFAGTQSGSNQMRNAGTFKTGTIGENWNTYTRNGLRDYLSNIVQRINMAPDEETKNAIRNEAINTVGNIQQLYAKAYQGNLTPSEERDAVRALQQAFQNENGNAYFGNIADNINLPIGHDTSDTLEGNWVDGYWGPRTSIRNWGSTEYGNADYYKNIADLATQAGLVYAPNADWTYGNGENGPYQLYGLSMAPTETPRTGYYNGITQPEGWNEWSQPKAAPAPTKAVAQAPKASDEWEVAPNYKNENLRYAGLLGPAVGLVGQAFNVGRPKTWLLDEAAENAGKVALARPSYISGYYQYRPEDTYLDEIMAANSNASTIKAGTNSAMPIGNKEAFILAADKNYQDNVGRRRRETQRYNNNERLTSLTQQKDTDKYNAGVSNEFAMRNAGFLNDAYRTSTNARLMAARDKIAADNDWYGSMYGNIAGLFKGIGDLGRENAQHNMIAEMAADGIFGTMSPRTNTGRRGKYLTFTKKNVTAKGGKLNKKGGK